MQQGIPRKSVCGLNKALTLVRRSVSKQTNSPESRRSFLRFLKVLVRGPRQPIFIIGAPRSGTSFLGRCISKLPSIAYFHEPDATKFAASQFGEQNWSSGFTALYHSSVYRLLIWGRTTEKNPRFAEKTPRNCFLVHFLADTFPSSVFIHVIRDGRDAALSLSKKPWLAESQRTSKNQEPGGYRYGPYPRFWVERNRRGEFSSTTDIHRCAWSWKRHVETALKARENLSSERYLELRYENFCHYPFREGKKIADFLGFDVDHESEYLLKLQEASTSSIGKHKTGLTPAQRIEIIEEAGSLLRHLGYL